MVQERVQIDSSPKVECQVDNVVKKAIGPLAFFENGLEYSSWDIIMQLLKSLMKSLLIYCVQYWSPNLRKL